MIDRLVSFAVQLIALAALFVAQTAVASCATSHQHLIRVVHGDARG